VSDTSGLVLTCLIFAWFIGSEGVHFRGRDTFEATLIYIHSVIG
jgi:hypothetical protein